jgi:putative oxidoreductase
LFSIFAIFAARCLLVVLFLPFSALDKTLNFDAAVGQAVQAAPSATLARALILAGLAVEVFGSLAILSGIGDRLGAFILSGYCVVTALLWKQFWRAPDFRLKGESKGRDIFWDFLKNLAVAGGFLMLTFGADASGVARFLQEPFASSHPYAAAGDGSKP